MKTEDVYRVGERWRAFLGMLRRFFLRAGRARREWMRDRQREDGPAAANRIALIPTVKGQALLARLACSDGRKAIWCVQLDLACHFVIDSRHNRIYAPARYLEMPAALLDALMAFRGPDYVQVDDSHLDAMRRQAGASRMLQVPFEQFVWMACQRAEPRLPIAGDLVAKPFRLARWPGFTRLSHSGNHMRWSGRLVQGAASLAELVASGGELPEAAKFYNACAVGGLLAADPSAVGQDTRTGLLQSRQKPGQMHRKVTG